MSPYHHCNDGPCPAPPHPDLQARLRTQFLQVQGGPEESTFRAATNRLSAPTGTIPGLNDGQIFPESHFEGAPSVRQLATAALERSPLRGDIRVVLVLVDFADKPMAPGAVERFQDLFFSTGKISTGSVTEYYADVSNSKISLTGEIVGPYRMPLTLNQYANNEHGHGTTYPNLRTLAADALTAADGQVNFAPYDNDGNGYVDAFIVVHAGSGAEQTGNKDDIWSAKWVLPEETQVDGVKVYSFLTIPEDALLGVSAHELGHLLFGWPDLYDYDDSSAGIGDWCLMAGGSWGGSPYGTKPTHPSAWCKANQGWVDVVTDTENQHVTLSDVKTSKIVHKLWKNGTPESEYFLVENRQVDGFDTFIPGGGLLVWHVDDTKTTNADDTHRWVDLLQADGLRQLNTAKQGGDAGDPFPGLSNNRTFTSISSPNSKSYSGEDTFVSITNISESGPIMTMDITVNPIAPGSFNARTWYRLRNSLSGHSLDILNDGLNGSVRTIQLAPEGNFSGQFWQIVPQSDGSYCLRTMYTGPGMQLDINGDDKTNPLLVAAGNFSGQLWQFQEWGDGTYYLTNLYSGGDMCLDSVDGGTEVIMRGRDGGRPTQRWTVTPAGEISESGF